MCNRIVPWRHGERLNRSLYLGVGVEEEEEKKNA